MRNPASKMGGFKRFSLYCYSTETISLCNYSLWGALLVCKDAEIHINTHITTVTVKNDKWYKEVVLSLVLFSMCGILKLAIRNGSC